MEDVCLVKNSVSQDLDHHVHLGASSTDSSMLRNLVSSNHSTISVNLDINPTNPVQHSHDIVSAQVMKNSMINYHDPMVGDAQADQV